MATLAEAEKMSASANINGVAAFIREHGSEHDRVTIQVMKESLMSAYLEEVAGREMDEFIFSDIQRIANL